MEPAIRQSTLLRLVEILLQRPMQFCVLLVAHQQAAGGDGRAVWEFDVSNVVSDARITFDFLRTAGPKRLPILVVPKCAKDDWREYGELLVRYASSKVDNLDAGFACGRDPRAEEQLFGFMSLPSDFTKHSW